MAGPRHAERKNPAVAQIPSPENPGETVFRFRITLQNSLTGSVTKNSFGSGSLIDAIIADIREQTHVMVKKEDFRQETLPLHLFMNFRVVDEHNRMLEMSRNLASLKSDFGKQAREAFRQLAELRSSGKKEKTSPSAKHGSDHPGSGQ